VAFAASKRAALTNLHVIHGDMLTSPCEDATLVYFASLLFDARFIRQLCSRFEAQAPRLHLRDRRLDDGRLRLIGALLLPNEDPVPFGQRLPLPRLLVDTQLRRLLRHLELHRLRCRLARCEEQHLSRTLLGGGAALGVSASNSVCFDLVVAVCFASFASLSLSSSSRRVFVKYWLTKRILASS
jgi:hypothetical protein